MLHGTAPLRVQLLGTWNILVEGRPLPHSRSRKEGLALAYLVTRHGQIVDRRALADMLWPESEGDKAANLRILLTHVRAALDSESWRIRSPSKATLTFDISGADVDLVTFQRLIHKGDTPSLRNAVALYEGPLLEGWGDDAAEAWVLAARQREENRYLRALNRLFASVLEFNDVSEGLALLHRLALAGSLDEANWQTLLERSLNAEDFKTSARIWEGILRWFPHPSMETLQLLHRLPASVRLWVGDEISERQKQQKALSGFPPFLTALVGRDDAVQAVEDLLAGNTLISLVGVGGIGKTRLATHIAFRNQGRFRDGVYFIDLAAVSDPELVAQAFVAMLSLREAASASLLEVLTERLRGKRLLLVVDNCEHLIPSVCSLLKMLLTACSSISIITTSREALGLTGETVVRLAPLSLPEENTRASMLHLHEAASVELFMARAKEKSPAFALTPVNAADVARICRALDGIPLALELAAALLDGLTVEQIADYLSRHMALLSSQDTTLPERQRTLHCLFSWSYARLTCGAQALLRRLCVFAGSFTQTAAAYIGDAKTNELHKTLCLKELVQKSLVQREETEAGTRYRLLEPVRQYCFALPRALEEDCDASGKHAAFYFEMAQAAQDALDTSEEPVWSQKLQQEQFNLHVALAHWQASEESPGVMLEFALALWRYWFRWGRFKQGRRALGAALEKSGHPHLSSHAQASYALGCLAHSQGDLAEATHYFDQALALAQAQGDARIQADALYSQGSVAGEQGDRRRALALTSTALVLYRKIGNVAGQAQSLLSLGQTQLYEGGDHKEIERLVKKSLALFLSIQHVRGCAVANIVLGRLAQERKDLYSSERLFAESLSRFRSIGDRWGEATALYKLGVVATLQGRGAQAEDYLIESLSLRWEMQNQRDLLYVLSTLASAAATEEKWEQAAERYAAAEALRDALGMEDAMGNREAIAQLRHRMRDGDFLAAWTRGGCLPLEQVVARLLSARLPVCGGE